MIALLFSVSLVQKNVSLPLVIYAEETVLVVLERNSTAHGVFSALLVAQW